MASLTELVPANHLNGQEKFQPPWRLPRHNSGCGIDGGHRDGAGGENLKCFEQLDAIWRPKRSSGLLSADQGRPEPSRADPKVALRIFATKKAPPWDPPCSALDGPEEAAVRYRTANDVKLLKTLQIFCSGTARMSSIDSAPGIVAQRSELCPEFFLSIHMSIPDQFCEAGHVSASVDLGTETKAG